jgi:hypothetical protein
LWQGRSRITSHRKLLYRQRCDLQARGQNT